jgi:hypothetical protein
MFCNKDNQIHGAFDIKYNNIQWNHLHACEFQGNFTYTVKTFLYNIERKDRKPFGPYTSVALNRRMEGGGESFYFDLVYFILFFFFLNP